MKARKVFAWIAAALAVAAIAAVILVVTAYRSDIRAGRERITGRSAVVPTPYGDVEYTEGGNGPDVLVIHGAGGGFDQGELIVEAVLEDRFGWIAPSRFGYLRSTFREGATHDDQAHAYACLLDYLGVRRGARIVSYVDLLRRRARGHGRPGRSRQKRRSVNRYL
jgi:hypothetical protein